MTGSAGDDFARRREEMKRRINPLDRELLAGNPDRKAFFDAVYNMADGDAAAVPWADLKPKDKIAEWLAKNPGNGKAALDIACGLGDHAEALEGAGYKTTAFDISEKAISWATQRFPDTSVDYLAANLMEPPKDWKGGFDLVNECYTIQSVPPPLHDKFARAIAALVKPGGTLLVYTRTRPQDSTHDGPPWPLMPSETGIFAELGFEAVTRERFEIERPDRRISHEFGVWSKG